MIANQTAHRLVTTVRRHQKFRLSIESLPSKSESVAVNLAAVSIDVVALLRDSGGAALSDSSCALAASAWIVETAASVESNGLILRMPVTLLE